MKIDYLKTLTAVERLKLYVDYLKNKKYYSVEERKIIERYFEDQ